MNSSQWKKFLQWKGKIHRINAFDYFSKNFSLFKHEFISVLLDVTLLVWYFSRISEPWNQKMPLSSLFIAFLYINFVKNLDFCLKFSSKKAKILWKIVKSINAMNFPFSLRWIFIARIFFIAMNSLLAYMYNTYLE